MILEEFAQVKKTPLSSQIIANYRKFSRNISPNITDASITEKAINLIESYWNQPEQRMRLIPGKEAISAVNKYLQENGYGISVTSTTIIDNMLTEEIPEEMIKLIDILTLFSKKVHS